MVEGLLLTATPALRNLYDHLVFIETPEPIRRDRRYRRDQFERGRDAASIERFWIRAEESFADRGPDSKDSADQVIDGAQSPQAMLADLTATFELEKFA